MTYEVEIKDEGKHVGWLSGKDLMDMETIAELIEDAGYDVDWGDNE